ncbi:MAG: tetratricopeptide repeat protein [Candidatus Omnitrophota bacterium]
MIPFLIIIILGFSVYANSLGGEFLWDDDWLVENNIHIRNFSQPLSIFTENKWTDTARRFHFYRPLQIFSYMLDYSIWKFDVRGYHLTNILLHTLAALLIYFLINLLYRDPLLASLASIFFVVHPIHTEAVAYISGRADPLAAVFILLALISYIKSIQPGSKRLYLLALLSYTAALFSRESALIFPLILLLYHYTFGKEIRAKKLLPIAVITLFYILCRYTVSKDLLPTYPESSVTLLHRLPGFFAAITEYTRLLFLPFGLHMEYGNKLFKIVDFKAASGIVITTCLLVYIFKHRRSKGVAFFSVSWFFITLIPHTNIYPIRAYMAEHWLYLPSVGFFLLLAKGFSYLCGKKGFKIPVLLLSALLVFFYSYLTIRQNAYWQNAVNFYKNTLQYAPDSALLHYNLANEYRAMGNKKEAVNLYEKALELDPDNAESYNNLGTIYFDLNRKDEAIACYKRAIKINPDFSYPYCNLANTYSAIGRIEDAIYTYKRAIDIEPGNALAHANLSILYYKQKHYEDAYKHYYIAKELGYKIDDGFLKLLESYRRKTPL